MKNLDELLFGTKTVEQVIDVSRPKGKDEVAKNDSLAKSIRRNGIDAVSSKRGADVVGSDFVVEGKESLVSKAVLQRLKGQIDDYVNVAKKRKGCRAYLW